MRVFSPVLAPALSLGLAFSSLPLAAQEVAKIPVTAVVPSAISQEIADKGIGPVLARLNGIASPTPEDRFAIAGLEFLSAVEGAYQWRMKYHIGQEWGAFFGTEAELPTDKDPLPFPPDAVTLQAKATLAAMERAQAALKDLAEGPEFGVTLALSDLWFDVDGDGKRSDWEGAGALLDGVIYTRDWQWDENGKPLPVPPEGAALPIIRFDNADAAWLTAYSHLVAGGADLVLAFDPTQSLQKVWDTRKLIDTHRAGASSEFVGGVDMLDPYFEPIAVLLDVLRQEPDAAHTQSAKAHWLETIRQNRLFWKLVATETDNAGEWIPNDRQVSATGLVFPEGTGTAWLAVLDDGEALLTGKKSAPFWRAPIGLDLGAWLDNPKPLPLDGVLQGWAITDYFTDAPMVSDENMSRFSEMFSDTGPFGAMVMIN